MKYEFFGFLPASFVYSIILSFLFLNYFRDNKKTSWPILIIAILHLAVIFVSPIITLMALMYLDEDLNVEFIKDSHKCSLYLELVSYINHGLNKLVYPYAIVYYESGFISTCYKIFPMTIKGWFNLFKELWIIPLGCVGAIIFFIFKEEILGLYNNFGIYMINYLNILDLVLYYFEFGFCIWDTFRYCFRTCKCCNIGDNYKYYMKGKTIYEKNKLSEKLEEKLDELCSITSEYTKEINNYKLTEVFDFIKDYGRSENYVRATYKREEKEEKIENIKQYQLEKLLSEPYREAKILARKIERVKNIYEREKAEYGGVKNCQCLYKCFCANNFCEALKIILFCFVCVMLFCLDFITFSKYIEKTPQTNDTNINSTDFFTDISTGFTSNINIDILSKNELFNSSSIINNFNNEELPSLKKQILSFFYGYFNIFTTLIINTGFYFIPILYAVVKRRPITGELIYDRGFSNNLEIILTVKKISSLVFASLYLGALSMILLYEDEPGKVVDKEEFNDFFKFFYLPYTVAVLVLKFVFLLLLSIITHLEYIKIPCTELYIADEGVFFLKKYENYCQCFKCRVEENIELGRNATLNENQIPNNSNLQFAYINNYA